MTGIVYLAGPMSGDPYGCVPKALAVWRALLDVGVVAFVPQLSALAAMVVPEVTYAEWLAYDLSVIEACAALVRLPGASAGADHELAFAEGRGIPVWRWEGRPGEALVVAAFLEQLVAA